MQRSSRARKWRWCCLVAVRGFAHIGVLRALQELRVPVDIVVGTSMGSVVGGAYAAGSSLDQMERLVRRTDWNAVVADRPPRDELVYRRREEDLLLPSRIEFGARMDGFRCRRLPPAMKRWNWR
jgi:NTE family protein